MDREQDSLSGRVMRYARVGRAVGGVAARAATGRITGHVTGKSPALAVDAKELRDALGGLKGPLMKVAQILSTVPDLLPEEYTRELVHLQTNAPSMGWPFVKRRMAGELGRDWQNRFAEFDRTATAAASLGQVHQAVDRDGRAIACKLQYPDMASAVEADLKQLKLAFALYRRYDRAIDPSDIHSELRDRLREELDYDREARHMRLYRFILAGEDGVHVPEPVESLCTNRLLSMTWLDGDPMLGFAEQSLEERNILAMNMFRAWYRPFYGYGVIHGDPHLGNYSVRQDLTINLLDYGCIRVFPPTFVGAVIDLYRALRDEDMDMAVHAYETWGFTNLDCEMIKILNHWARFLYGPLMQDRKQRIQEGSIVTYGAEVAAKVHSELRRIGGVKPPPEFVLIDRAAIGLGSVFTHLQAEINWHQEFHYLIADFDEQELAKRQKSALSQHGLG